VAARVMRQVLPLMSRTTRMKARVTRAVVQAMAVVLLVREILHHPIVRAGVGVSDTPGT
jgi:hypothetical protein